MKVEDLLLIWLYNQDLVYACLRRSLHCTPKVPAIAVHAIRVPGFRSSLVSTAFRYGLKQGRSPALLITCGEPSSQKRVIGFLAFLSAPTFHCRSAGPGGQMSLSDLSGNVFSQAAKAAICSLNSSLYL
jgi:hypothetical protein